MNAFWSTVVSKVVPFAINVIRKKPATITLGNQTPSTTTIVEDATEDFVVDKILQPSEYPDFDNALPPTTFGDHP